MEAESVLKKAEQTVILLKEKGLTIATAESCTGGMISAFLTSVSGVSEVFELGITSYSCRIKNEILKVDATVLEEKGAICEETAAQMAHNVRLLSGSDIGVSVTGVAGPASSEGHPVGYIFIGISGDKGCRVKLLDLKPDERDKVRLNAVMAVFDLIKEYIFEGTDNEQI